MDICPECSLPRTPEIFKKNVGYPIRTGWISFLSILYWISFGISSLSAIVLIVLGKTWVEHVESFIFIIAASFLDAVLFFYCAYGLWHLKNYGRKILLIFAYVQLIAFPIGTIIGILIIRYFRKPEIKALFSEEKFNMLSKEQIMKLALKIERSPKIVTIVLLTLGLYLVSTLLFSLLFFVLLPGGVLKKNAKPYIASVGRDKITVIEYEKQLVTVLQNYRQQFKDNFNKQLVTQLGIPDQILNNMINSTVIRAEADKLNITVSKDELKEKIINYPAFQRDGKFIGIENYKRILAYHRMDINEFEDQLKYEIITNKLRELVTASLEIDEETLKEKFKKEKDNAELEYILLKPNRVNDKIEVNDIEIANYYQENKEDFKSPERRSGHAIVLKFDDYKKEISIDDRELFDYFNANRSQYMGQEKMQKEFSEVKPIIRDTIEKQKLNTLVNNKLTKIYEEIKNVPDIKTMAKKLGVKIVETGLLTRGEAVKNIDESGYISRQLFQLKETEISSPLMLPEGMAIVQLVKTEKPMVEPLEKVKEKVKNEVIQAKKIKRLIEEAQAITAELNNMKEEKDIEKFLKAKDLSADTTTYKRGNKLSYMPEKKGLDDFIFSLEERQYSTPIDLKTAVAILKVKSKKVTGPMDFEIERKEFYNQKLDEMKNNYFASYVYNKREAYNVRINQELYQEIKDHILARIL
jgi:peptidyl-prolyl cis-trans isomerase D